MSQLSNCALANRQVDDCHLKINIAFDNDSDSILSLQPYPMNNVDTLYEECISNNIQNVSCKTSVTKPVEECNAMPILTETNECFIKLEDSNGKNHSEYYFKFESGEKTLFCKTILRKRDHLREPIKACQSTRQTEPVKRDTSCIGRLEMFMELEYQCFLDLN